MFLFNYSVILMYSKRKFWCESFLKLRIKSFYIWLCYSSNQSKKTRFFGHSYALLAFVAGFFSQGIICISDEWVFFTHSLTSNYYYELFSHYIFVGEMRGKNGQSQGVPWSSCTLRLARIFALGSFYLKHTLLKLASNQGFLTNGPRWEHDLEILHTRLRK